MFLCAFQAGGLCVWAAKIHKLTYFYFLEITRRAARILQGKLMDKVSGKFWSLQPQYSCLSGWGWAGAQPGICSARPTQHCAFCFPSIQLSVKMEKGTVPGMLGMGLQPSVSSRGCSWDAPESQRCLCIVAQEPGQRNLGACRHVRPGVRPLLGPRPLDPGRVHARASGSLRAHPGS